MAAERSVIVTGASTGIGAAAARRLDTDGWRVFAGVRRDADGAALTEGASDRLVPLHLDVTDAAQIAEAVATVTDAVGDDGLHGVVNNAGIAVAGPLELLPLDAWRRQFEVNVFGQVAVTQAFLPLLHTAGGRVVNVGSISGKIANGGMGAYAGSKHAMEAISDSLRIELAPFGLHVSLVDPGVIATPIWDKSTDAGDELLADAAPELRARYEGLIGRLKAMAARGPDTGIAPSAVADAIAHALSAPRPRTRYYVGTDAKMGNVLSRFVPDRLRDRVLALNGR